MPRPRKRPRGLTKRPESPYWQYDRRIRGRRIKESLQTENYQEACRLTEERNHRYQSGVTLPTKAKFSDVGEKWMAMKLRRRNNEKDKRTIRHRWDTYIQPFFQDMRLSAITKQDLEDFKERLEKTHLSMRTVDHILGQVTDFFGWAADKDHVAISPVPKKDFRMKFRRRKPKPLPPAEADAVCSVPGVHGLICRTLRGTGLRWAELCRLDVADINWKLSQITVRGSKSDDRVVPLGDTYDELHELFGNGYVGRLFTFSAESSGSFARVVCRRSGVARFTVHRLRHTFGTEYIERGGSLAMLQDIMGHTASSTTRGYAQARPEALRAEVNRVHSGTRTHTSVEEEMA